MKIPRFNLNKIFPFFSLRIKLIIAFALLSAIPLIIVGIVGIQNSVNKMQEIALENLTHDVLIHNERAQNFIANVNIDIKYLLNTGSFQNYLAVSPANRNVLKENFILLKLQDEILNFAKSHFIYYQFRFIDFNGDEKFHIQYSDSGFKIFINDSLSTQSFKFYFNLTEKSVKNNISMIPAELIGPNHNTVPAISFAIRVYDFKNNLAGIFIADIFAKELFKVLEQKAHLTYGKEVIIVNNEGHYLYHSEKKKNWNKLLAFQDKDNLFAKFSSKLTADIISGKSGIIKEGSDQIIAYAPLFVSTYIGGGSYFIFESVNQRYIIEPAQKFATLAILSIIIFLIVAISLGIVATNQIAKPIYHLKKGAEIISSGNYSYQLNIQTNDEIEQLATQFNIMAKALGEREKLLNKNKENLERVVVEKTKELKSEKEKLQAILDNVPSAFILMDDECIILSASNAVKSISGFIPDQLIGKKCSEAFGNEFFCENCHLTNSSKKKGVYSFIENKISSTGDDIYIEHISMPISINKNKRAILEILTDITERKKTEEHLLKIQKLITIGETSAFIAHEMRNSLTSVKMLLQLQGESILTDEEKKSLNLSLESINKMEKVVNNLLSLGHKIDYKLSYININAIIEELIVLIKPKFENDGITFIIDLDDKIPLSFIDVDQFKEAIVNLIINSSHAIKGNGTIGISTKIVVLEKDLTDFGYIDSTPINNNEEYKISLKKEDRIISLEVTDTGVGISKNNLKKIFDPFYTTKENGSGLGLAMVKRTVNNHGGLIKVNSQINKGTTFNLLLPVRENV